jgi:sugar transferase (PEP-CTERM/EpsH1 system associated)
VSDRIRVAHVLHSLETGGMEKGVTTLVRNASPDMEQIVVCLTTSGPMARNLPEGAHVVEMRKPRGNSIRFFWKLARTFKKLGVDVVHTRNWGGMDGIIGARLAGIRAVVHGEHGWEIVDRHGQSARRRKVRRFLQRWVRTFTCVSKDIAGWLERDVGIRKPIRQIYNGVDTDRMAPGGDGAEVRAELGIAPGTCVVGKVGRLNPIKDYPTLIRAFGAARARGCDAALVIAGDDQGEGEALRALGGEGVHFLGGRADVPRVLRAMDVFVLSSLNEGISNTILEAMATALPVVATSVGGNPELVVDGETGRLFATGDVDALAGHIEAYARDPALRARHGAAGRQRVLDRFSIRAMRDGYESVYREVAGAR